MEKLFITFAVLSLIIMLMAIGALYQMFRSYKLEADFKKATISSVKKEYCKEIEDAYSAGWRSGFNAFRNNLITTNMVDLAISRGKHEYMKEVK